MTKPYDRFVSGNPTLFKASTLDLFVKVGYLSQEVYIAAKSALEAYQEELQKKENNSTDNTPSYENTEVTTTNA